MKKLICLLLAVVMLTALVACGNDAKTTTDSADTADTANTPATDAQTEEVPAEKQDVNVFVLTGPTGVGAVNMWDAADNGEGLENYHFNAVAAPEEIVAKISAGEADIAAISTNLAAKLYKKTDGGIKVLAVNTLGVLSVLNNTGASISSLSDLAGRKIVTTGKGANPEFIINYLLTANGLDPAAMDIEYKADGSELPAVWATDPEAVIIAPAPVSTAILLKYEGSELALDLTDEWQKVATDSELMMGCIVARTDYIEQNPTVVENFLADYKASIEKATEDPATTGTLCEKYAIVAKAAIATKAIPSCHLCFINGEEMQTKLTGYLKVLFDADNTSIGAMPDDGFWYESK